MQICNHLICIQQVEIFVIGITVSMALIATRWKLERHFCGPDDIAHTHVRNLGVVYMAEIADNP